MSVSVVIPSKDRRKYLEKVLPSYLSQPEVTEVIIVNDGSSDDTDAFVRGVAKTDQRIVYIHNKVNRGVPAAKNIGIARATGRYLFVGEDDLELTPHFFKTMLAHLHATGADLLCSRVVWRHDGESAKTALARVNKIKAKQYVDRRTMTHVSGMDIGDDSQELMSDNPALGTTKLFKQIGFDEGYKVNFWREETDFQFSVQEAGYTLYVCPHALCYNYIIPKDRGGVHAAAGFKRVRWVVANNWRFIRKHRIFIRHNFDIGSPYVYIARFTIVRVWNEILLPFAVSCKRAIFGPR